MSSNLVIVESPAKAKTIEKFLGGDYVVKSSIGHIRDMPKKGMGISIENNFQPTYEVSSDKKKVVSELKKAVKNSQTVYLATDEDREGEAIAWHLIESLNLSNDTPRIVFNEITKKAITEAIKSPRTVDFNLVNAQQARRIIDRIVGFEISPILWRKVSGARSAGRVQSPVVRLVVEREREINAHNPKITFKSTAILSDVVNNELEVKLEQDFLNKDDAINFANLLKDANLVVSSVTQKPSKRSPKPPFITSTLQQEASQRLGFSVKQTMSIAQNLYRDGAITYMRTDSFHLSDEAIAAASSEISKKFGKDSLNIRHYKTSDKSAQEAHEAIRPTDLTKSQIVGLDESSAKLYDLIYRRTLASQMTDAELERTIINVKISNSEHFFSAEGEVLIKKGFLQVYGGMTDDKLLPKLTQGDKLSLISFLSRETFSRAKARYTEASLVKTIEKMGIGRPSTFATMVSTVQERGYVSKETRPGIIRDYDQVEITNNEVIETRKSESTGAEKNKLFPTNTAYLLTDFLVKNFNNIIDYQFTANLEDEFDMIAKEDANWQSIVGNFYDPFHQQIEVAKEVSREETHGYRELGIDPKSGKTVSVRHGRYGAFAQIGDKDSEESPTFASLKRGQDIETISLDEALDLFNLPRTLGQTEDGLTIKTNYGRFGPYIQYGKKYVSLKDDTPEDVQLERALELIAEKEKLDAERVIKTFPDSDIQILNGRFGPYIWNGKKRGKGQKNITIKKFFEDKDPSTLTLNECEKAISGKLTSKSKKTKKKK